VFTQLFICEGGGNSSATACASSWRTTFRSLSVARLQRFINDGLGQTLRPNSRVARFAFLQPPSAQSPNSACGELKRSRVGKEQSGAAERILCAPTAFGKTAVAAWLIAKREVNTLVVVHRQQRLDQWIERLGMFLNMPAQSIGHIGGGKPDRTPM